MKGGDGHGHGHTPKTSFGSMVRKRLSDITNSHPPSKSPLPADCKLFSIDDCSLRDYIENLVKENLALAKIIADKNKLIELTGNELHKLRVNLQKMQEQNWDMAITNSRMLAELNLGKDKLKTLNHEIACKNGVIKAKNVELKQKVKANNIQKSCCSMQPVEEETIVENKFDEKEEKIKNHNIVRRPIRRSQSMGSLLAKEIMEIPENKRRCMRRQSSARFKSREQEKEDDEEEVLQVGPVNNSSMNEEVVSSLMVSSERKNGGGESDRRRRGSSSMGIRPLRKATEKVHSYRETPINVKMRR